MSDVRSKALTREERVRVGNAEVRQQMRERPIDRAAATAPAATVLQYARQLAGLSVEAVAKRIDCHNPKRLQLIESGKKDFLTSSEEVKLKKLFGLSAGDLQRPATEKNRTAYLHGLPIEDAK